MVDLEFSRHRTMRDDQIHNQALFLGFLPPVNHSPESKATSILVFPISSIVVLPQAMRHEMEAKGTNFQGPSKGDERLIYPLEDVVASNNCTIAESQFIFYCRVAAENTLLLAYSRKHPSRWIPAVGELDSTLGITELITYWGKVVEALSRPCTLRIDPEEDVAKPKAVAF